MHHRLLCRTFHPIFVDVPELVMRRYYCPRYVTLFWTDLAEKGDQIEFDVKLDLEKLVVPSDS